MGEWAFKTFIKALLEWLWAGFHRLAQAYKNRADDEKVNQDIKKKVEDAQSREELQAALDEAARHIGRP